MDRRDFIKTTLSGSTAIALSCSQQKETEQKRIMTVCGPINASELGRTLPHEHIMVDFIGADKVSKDRYDPEHVYKKMLPYLEEIKEQGVTGFIDCTPMFLGRDVKVLKRLSEATGIHIITNSGQYKEPYLPQYAFKQSAEELANGWIAEFEQGIDGTSVKPDFIKIAIHKKDLEPIQQKIVRAACKTSNATGATIACHSSYGPGILQMLDIFEEENTPPDTLVMVHANSEKDVSFHYEIAKRGVWIEYDNIGGWESEKHMALLNDMVERGFEKQLLLSMDRGWYRIGEPEGGNVKPYTHLFSEFIPALKTSGWDDNIIEQITVKNPANAFALDV
jgi:predicted metal-dependent phosphotriesterase family hydrolase